MDQENFCKDCLIKHDCRESYRRLGNSECPPVFYKVVMAFLLPMVIFTVSLAVFEKIFSGGSFFHSSQKLQSTVSLIIALLITTACMFIVKIVNKLFRKLSFEACTAGFTDSRLRGNDKTGIALPIRKRWGRTPPNNC